MPRSCTASAQSGMERRREIRVWAGPEEEEEGGGREARMGALLGLEVEGRRGSLRGHFGEKREERVGGLI